MARYVIGSRGSKLALIQTNFVKAKLEAAYSEDEFEIKIISTKGDRIQDKSIAAIGDNALFTREIENALLSGEIDLAVHSMKDLAAELPPGLCLSKAWPRADPRDCIVAASTTSAQERPLVIATGSVRRDRLVKRLYGNVSVVPIRGNVDTRLRKLDEGVADALILAAAGLKRMGLEGRISEYLDPHMFVPAPCQGQLAIELRGRDLVLKEMVDALHDEASEKAARLERDFLKRAGGDCKKPIGAYYDGKTLTTFCEGTVYLVGAGPGAKDLITVRGLELIKEADALVYDRLVAPELISQAPAYCELHYVGKESGHSCPRVSVAQKDINGLLVELASRCPKVVRLKGGDPFVFGRGGEEALALKAAGVKVEVVPGISSSIAAAECAGIPVTHRGLAGGFEVVTEKSDTPEKVTKVALMSLEALSKFVATLPKDMPVAVIAEASTKYQRVVVGTAADIVEKVAAAGIVPPAVIVAGEVVKLHDELCAMVATESMHECKMEVELLPDALTPAMLDGYTHLVFTSRNAARALKPEVWEYVRGHHLGLFAIGTTTAREITRLSGVLDVLVPWEANSKSLKPYLNKRLPENAKPLYLTAEGIPNKLAPIPTVAVYRQLKS